MKGKKRACTDSPRGSSKRSRAPEHPRSAEASRHSAARSTSTTRRRPMAGSSNTSRAVTSKPSPVTTPRTPTSSAGVGPKLIQSAFQKFPRELTEKVFGNFTFAELREACKGGKLIWLMAMPYLYSTTIISPLLTDLPPPDHRRLFFKYTRVLTINIPMSEISNNDWSRAERVFRDMIPLVSESALRVISFTPATVINTAIYDTLCKLLEKATKVTKVFLPSVIPHNGDDDERTEVRAWITVRKYDNEEYTDVDLVIGLYAHVRSLKRILGSGSAKITSVAIFGTSATTSDGLQNFFGLLGSSKANPLRAERLELCRLDLTHWHKIGELVSFESLNSLGIHECIGAQSLVEAVSHPASNLKRFVLTDICAPWTPPPPQHKNVSPIRKESAEYVHIPHLGNTATKRPIHGYSILRLLSACSDLEVLVLHAETPFHGMDGATMVASLGPKLQILSIQLGAERFLDIADITQLAAQCPKLVGLGMTIGLDGRQWAKRGPFISAPGIHKPGYLYALKDVAVPLTTLPDFLCFAAFTPLSEHKAKELPSRDDDLDVRLRNKFNWILSMVRSRGLSPRYISTTFRKVQLGWSERILPTRHFTDINSRHPQMVSDLSSLENEHNDILKILESRPIRSLQDLAQSRGVEYQLKGPRDFKTML